MIFGAGILLVLLLCFASTSRAQEFVAGPQTERISRTLEDAGFENIRVAGGNDRLILAYENRRYRYEVRAFREALARIAPYVKDATPVTFIQERDGIPMRTVTVSSDGIDYERAGTDGEHIVSEVEASLDVESQWTAVRRTSRHASSYGRVDLVLQPRITAQLGNYADAVQTEISLVPELTSTLARGLRIRAQLVLPIQNDLEVDGDYVRPRIVSAGQTIRLRDDVFVALSAGYFSANRYGADLQGRIYLDAGRFALGGRIGCTGFAGIRDGAWTQSRIDRWTASFTADYSVPKYTLIVRSSLERFVYGDFGWRVDVDRSFGEVQLGFFGVVSEGENNAGVRFTIPLFGRKYARPAPFRMRPARAFDWEYRYRGFPYTGRRYETGHDLDALWEGVFPAFFVPQMGGR